jgi:DNA-binding cell septation regulator SpoVG
MRPIDSWAESQERRIVGSSRPSRPPLGGGGGTNPCASDVQHQPDHRGDHSEGHLSARLLSNVVFSPGSPADCALGLLGFVAVTIGQTWRIDGIAVRRTLDGRVVLSFPVKRDRQGRSHPIVHPVHGIARKVITTAVLDALHLDLSDLATASSPASAQGNCTP